MIDAAGCLSQEVNRIRCVRCENSHGDSESNAVALHYLTSSLIQVIAERIPVVMTSLTGQAVGASGDKGIGRGIGGRKG